MDKKITILNMDDPDFEEDLFKAMGLEDGDTIEIITPQFTRTDGRNVTYIPKTMEEYLALPEKSKEELLEMGCLIWDESPAFFHWLFPGEWYDHIPEGLEIVDINEERSLFSRETESADIRFGALAYGFLQYKKK